MWEQEQAIKQSVLEYYGRKARSQLGQAPQEGWNDLPMSP